MRENIVIRGAAQHNLKNVDAEIPRNKLVVITGLSGSGKSSLAFDTLYAEGQRRYVESLSAYARQFLDRLQKPKVEHIEGLSPAIAIEQRTAGGTPRSTVATVTEIYDYLRLLYAHIGHPHCPDCGKSLTPQSAQKIVELLQNLPPDRKMILLAPIIKGKKGEHREILQQLREDGFVRARIDGEIVLLDDYGDKVPSKTKAHSIDAVVDRLKTGSGDVSRLTDSVETALRTGGGVLSVLVEQEDGSYREEMHSEKLACVDCGKSYGELKPRNFSFNAPYGACPECHGLGFLQVMDAKLVIPDDSLSIRNGAIPGWRRGPRHLIMYYNLILRKISEYLEMPDMLTTPFRDLPEKVRNYLLYGSGDEPLEFTYRIRGKSYQWSKPFEGILENLRRRMVETESDAVRDRLKAYLVPKVCPACQGRRLNPVSLAVTVGGIGIDKFNAMSVEKALQFVENIKLADEEKAISADVLKEIRSRLAFLNDVGLNYLTLDRISSTLSGGEAQRIRLATQLGCGLVGVLYILDEPSIGLHQRDNDRLLNTLEHLRDMGNSVLVVEHDLDTIRRADFVMDMGPGAGSRGGELVAAGTPEEIAASARSLTGDYLAGRRLLQVPEKRLKGNGKHIYIRGASHNNLKNVDVKIPLGTFTCVTGVSGSGKSSLINGILVRELNRQQGIQDALPGKFRAIEGLEHIGKTIVIDQSPIGRTPRSNPATYIEAFGHIRTLFSQLPEAKIRGYTPGRFSFNIKGGRCEECKGDGIKKIEMQFLSDVYVECSVCHGRRFNRETLGVRYRKQNIADVLDMTVSQAAEFFSAVPPLARKLETLREVGLGYLQLGQPATTLSGGEAQRVKLAAELARIPHGHTLYILDEPTTGLHLADIEQLMKVLFRLRDMGNTILVIEHNLDVIKCADHLIDMGPEGGENGGTVIGTGTPEELAANPASHTGRYLKPYLQ